ncbi:MAG: ABC transporter permease, partial [Bacteroidales bacterium]
MFHLIHSLRIFYRNMGTTLLVVISLSAGLTAYVFISSRVSFHRSFDTHINNFENIYRVITSTYHEGNLTISQPRTQRGLGEELVENYPDVQHAGFLCNAIFNHYSIGEQTFTNEHSFHCSEGLVKMLSLQIIEGRSTDLLTRPNVVLISESFANQYFGDEDPIGKTILQFPATLFEIEAVFRDLPVNTHFSPEILISFHDNMWLPPPVKEDWGEFVFTTYLELDDHTDLPKLEGEITRLCSEKNEKLIESSHSEFRFQLQPLADIHTRSRLKNELGKNVRGDYLTILQMVSIFILIISGFNYIYFTFIRLSNNSVQYGLKRVLGADNRTFLIQFLSESLAIHFVALVIAVLGLLISKVLVKGDLQFGINDLTNRFWFNLMLIALISAVLNPLILVHLFSRRSTLELLSKGNGTSYRSFSFKQLFTIVQFAIIIFLTSTILGMGRQIRFLETRDIGMELRDKLVIVTPSNLRRTSQRVNNLEAFEGELIKLAGIQHVSTSNNAPGDTPTFSFSASEHKEENGIKIALFLADSSYLEMFGIEMLGGEGFRRAGPESCIINKRCMNLLGYSHPEEVINRTLYLNDDSGLQTIECSVIGVCEDFNFTNTKELPDPVAMLDWASDMMYGKYVLSVYPGTDEQLLLSQVEPLFLSTFPNFAFEYYWVEDNYNKQFEEEFSIIKTLKGFAVITLLLGILSLLSMVRHLSQVRTKEIGIRKVNGASRFDILALLNRHFIKWIAAALMI